MEKYSQFRDKGSGIAPFFPIPAQPSGAYLPLHIILFLIRIPLIFTVSLTYLFLCSWLPVGSLVKKAALWMILGIPGIWWIDLQIDGVKRGSLARTRNRLPQPGSIIASSFTSPIDCLYLAAIFDPIFTISYPNTRLVQRISLFYAIIRALRPPQVYPPPNTRLMRLSTLLRENPGSVVVVLPECTTTNGRAILPLSPSLSTAPPRAKIFAISLRYSAADVTTPVPGTYLSFLWNLCSKPSHSVRVRIAEAIYNTAGLSLTNDGAQATGAGAVAESLSSAETLVGTDDGETLTGNERKMLDRVEADLARLGRVKRVGLSVKEKKEFIKVWSKTRTIW